MNQYHEPYEELSNETKDVTRAFRSLIEEFEAVDWYNQRMDVTTNSELREILKHNRDEEMEHAAMTLEWLRRRIPELDDELRENLFKEGDIAGHHGEEEDGEATTSQTKSLNIK
ncbi:MAG TPA: encapsulin-associated ferritin-like protein [Candidatus Izemoplasmatales bacterium]|nr:encapsulin-associated ferritin-like protein [Candidatus Izemoplasmatales bacterium]